MWLSVLCVSALAAAARGQGAPAALQYDAAALRQNLPTNNHFLMFYAPWCGHCQKLEPTWEQLAELLNVDDSRVNIAKVDCTVEKEACSENEITGYPTLKFYKIGDSEGVKFRGIRDLPTLSNFINEQLGDSSIDDQLTIPIEANTCVELTEDNFADHVSHGYHFVKFYAPWCGHCQKLAPVWESLAESFAKNEAVSVSKIDCTLYRSICTQFEVKGYPTLLWIEDGKKIEKYSGQRTHEEFKIFVNKMLSISYGSDERSEDRESDGFAVMTLTSDNFHHGTKSGFVFVKFFAPWCGHCKRLAPTWEELGRKFIDHGKVKIAKIDCSMPVNKAVCANQNVEGFPSLFFYREGHRVSEYDGSRTLDDLYEYVIEQLSNSHDEL